MITDSDEALAGFTEWCEAHIDDILAIAFGDDHGPVPQSGDLSFEEALTFVRIELHTLDAVRSTRGLGESAERRYQGLCAMELDPPGGSSGQG